jgi:recombinational DNA repair ATPase RecF
VIKLETAHIEEVRGIRSLDIDFRKEKFAISGPNGSGKSGVIDAIEFGLTGQIGRLTGRGTKGLSVADHGPHVDKVKFPDAAFVELRVYLTDIKKSVTIHRKISAPKRPKITPSDNDVKAALAEIADHPEMALSRREILRFILVEPAKRAEEIQALLKLDEIGTIRSALFTAQNKLQTAEKAATSQTKANQEALLRHFQIPALTSASLLEETNKRRVILGLPEIADLTADTKLNAGLSDGAKTPEFNKVSALRDLAALSDAAGGFPNLAKTAVAEISKNLTLLESDPTLFAALQRRSFIEKGLELVDGPECPLCDTEWDSEQHLLAHLQAKLAKSAQALKVQQDLLKNGAAVAQSIVPVVTLLAPVQKLALSHDELEYGQLLLSWKASLDDLRSKLTNVEGLLGSGSLLSGDWLGVPPNLGDGLQKLIAKIAAKPDQSATLDAQTFLSLAQSRLDDYREGMRKGKGAKIAFKSAEAAYSAYCTVMDDELNALYEDVQEDFSEYYRALNGDDESKFTAKLTPSEGRLEFDVNFYERGLYPPAAFHSEGHQDGMGVCLYLALMKSLFGDRFKFALLDDVVMSVDSGHRHEFCKLLKTHFPDTQFIITTHDRVWAEQMKSAGLVTGKTSLRFYGWSIETGPIVESEKDVWDKITFEIEQNNIEDAAGILRRYLEGAARQLADQLVAAVPFRGDANYELGDLLPNVLTALKALYGKAASAAQSWGNQTQRDAVAARQGALSAAAGAQNAESWAVNKAVHYNAWANFSSNDFKPVVKAYRELLCSFRCDGCDSWLHVSPRGRPESLRCLCGAVNFNLNSKPK